MAEKRTRVTSLAPLNSRQVKWLTSRGEAGGSVAARSKQAWWANYFGIGLSEWTNPYAVFSHPTAWENSTIWQNFKASVQENLDEAKADKEVWAQYLNEGLLPPEARHAGVIYSGGQTKRGGYSQKATAYRWSAPPADPWALPEYFQWWQAENAYRRGYVAAATANTQDQLGSAVRNAVRARGGNMTANVARAVASDYRNQDPALEHFFEAYADELDQGTAKQFAKVSDLVKAALEYQEQAYLQFNPWYMPLLGAQASIFGLKGLGAVSKNVRAGTRVRFVPSEASYMLYSQPPEPGSTGQVTTVPFPGGKKLSYLPGPGGGLVYVKWDAGFVQGVSAFDLEVLSKRSK